MKAKPKFKIGDYVTDGRDTYYVYDIYGYGLSLEDCRSGSTTDMNDPRFFTKTKKQKTFKQEHNALCKKYAMHPGATYRGRISSTYKQFSGELIALLRKHGDRIYN